MAKMKKLKVGQLVLHERNSSGVKGTPELLVIEKLYHSDHFNCDQALVSTLKGGRFEICVDWLDDDLPGWFKKERTAAIERLDCVGSLQETALRFHMKEKEEV